MVHRYQWGSQDRLRPALKVIAIQLGTKRIRLERQVQKQMMKGQGQAEGRQDQVGMVIISKKILAVEEAQARSVVCDRGDQGQAGSRERAAGAMVVGMKILVRVEVGQVCDQVDRDQAESRERVAGTVLTGRKILVALVEAQEHSVP